jgi:hypothetical protein
LDPDEMDKNYYYGSDDPINPEIILTGYGNTINDLLKFFAFITPKIRYITPAVLLEKMRDQGEKIIFAIVTEKNRMQKFLNSLTTETRAEFAPHFYESIGKDSGGKNLYTLYWKAPGSTIPEDFYKNERETQIIQTREGMRKDKIREEERMIDEIQAKTRDERARITERHEFQYKNAISADMLKEYALIRLNFTEPEGEEDENIPKVKKEMERLDRLYNINLTKIEEKNKHPIDLLRARYFTDVSKEETEKLKRDTVRFFNVESVDEAIKYVDNSLNILKSGEIDYDRLYELQQSQNPKPPPLPKKDLPGLLDKALGNPKIEPKPAKPPVGNVVEEEKAQEEGDRGPPEEGAGEGIFYNAYQMATKGKRQRLPPPIRKFINQYGDRGIIYMKVCKKPIANFYDAAINITSFGKWSANKKAMNYDKMAHLYIVFSFGDSVYYRLEKNHVIEISIYSRDHDETCINIDMENNSVTFSELINNAYERYGFNYLYYDAIKANCQIFVSQTLDASNLLTTELKNYIMQDVEQVLTPYVNKIMSPFVNLAYRLDTLRRGDGAGSFR